MHVSLQIELANHSDVLIYQLIKRQSESLIPVSLIPVPVSPQVGEMVSVQGGDEELWRAEVRAVDHGHKTIRGYFFVKHHQWNENQLWKRESMGHAMDTIHFKSIVSILDGQWHGPYWKDNGY